MSISQIPRKYTSQAKGLMRKIRKETMIVLKNSYYDTVLDTSDGDYRKITKLIAPVLFHVGEQAPRSLTQSIETLTKFVRSFGSYKLESLIYKALIGDVMSTMAINYVDVELEVPQMLQLLKPFGELISKLN
jgi:hypothetical protein